MPHDVCYQLHQDRAGFIWIFTDDGMVRFDGTEMKKYTSGLNSNFTIDGDDWNDTLWVSTWKGGIHFLAGDSLHYFPVKVPGADIDLAFWSNRMMRFGKLIITYNFEYRNIYYYDGKSVLPFSFIAQLKRNKSDEPYEKLEFLRVRQEKLFAYNPSGVFRVLDTTLIKVYNKRIDAARLANDGLIYFTRDDSIFYTKDDFKSSRFYYRIKSEKIRKRKSNDIQITASGNICLGYTDSLPKQISQHHFYINLQTDEITDLIAELNCKVVQTGFLVDREGNIWLCTDGEGIYHIFESRFMKISSGLGSTPYITSLFVDKRNALYIGTKSSIYMMPDANAKNCKKVGKPDDPPFYVNRFFYDEKGQFQVSSRAGDEFNKLLDGYKVKNAKNRLLYFQSANYKFQKCSDLLWDKLSDKYGDLSITSIIAISPCGMEEDEQGNLFIATGSGLIRVAPGKKRKPEIKIVLANNSISDIVRYQGLMWIATVNGLYTIKPGADPQRFNSPIFPNGVGVSCLKVSSNGFLCIGTPFGLYIYDGKNIGLIKKRNGLAGDDITALTEWNKKWMVAGGIKGITLIPLEDLHVKGQPSLLLIEKVFINDEPATGIKNLSYASNTSFRIEFNTINFTYPENILYAYRLHNSEKWTEIPNKTLILSNLQAGEYEVSLRSRNIASDWSLPVGFKFSINAPWFRSIWFFVLLSLVLTAGTILVFFFRNRLRNKRIQAELGLSEFKLMAFQSQFNPHFISNTFNAIQYFLLKGDVRAVSNYMRQFADLTRHFLESSEVRFHSVKQELEILKKYLEIEKLMLGDKFDYIIFVDNEVSRDKEILPSMLLQPIVENAIYHGLVYLEGKRGYVHISINKQADGKIHARIQDNGVGRKAANDIRVNHPKIHKSRSGDIMNEIVKIINNMKDYLLQIDITDLYENDIASGTIVDIYFKKPNEH